MTVFTGENIRCVRGERLVLDGIGFTLGTGEALVLTGPNGSGKSTLLRLMAGLLRPSSGKLNWGGADIADDVGAHGARISYVGHADAVKPALSVMENVAFWADISGSGGHSATAAMQALGIAHLAALPARYLSAGQRRRVALSRMLTSGAVLWLLDEPTTALDAAAAAALGQLIADHRRGGGMVAVSTHGELGLADTRTLDLTA